MVAVLLPVRRSFPPKCRGCASPAPPGAEPSSEMREAVDSNQESDLDDEDDD
jgi:hypothetical protein